MECIHTCNDDTVCGGCGIQLGSVMFPVCIDHISEECCAMDTLETIVFNLTDDEWASVMDDDNIIVVGNGVVFIMPDGNPFDENVEEENYGEGYDEGFYDDCCDNGDNDSDDDDDDAVTYDGCCGYSLGFKTGLAAILSHRLSQCPCKRCIEI